MARRWWLLFRSLGVITVLFLTPIYARQLRPWFYYLAKADAAAQLALQISAVLLLEALVAAFLTLILSAGRALKLWGDRADANCAGFLAFASAVLCLLVLASPLNFRGLMFPTVSMSLSLALILAAIALLTYLGWQRVFALLNGFNQSSQIVLAAACPILLILVLAGGFGWRSFDPMPHAPQFAPDHSAKPNVVLISFDALTAEDMSLYGYRLPTTPRFEQLARRSYKFVNFVSTTDLTTPAVASLLTGQYPLNTRVFDIDAHIPHRQRKHNLAWILRRHGYTTAAIVTNSFAHPLLLRLEDSFSILPRPPMSPWFFAGTFLLQLRHSLLFDYANILAAYALQNFGVLFSRFNQARWVEPRAVFAAAEDFTRGAPVPYFLWIHLLPPHAPYLTDARFRSRFLPGSELTSVAQLLSFSLPDWHSHPSQWQHEAGLMRLRYDEDVAECDSALGQFLDWMAAGHRGANTILIVTADHGENFSGGFWQHGSPDLRYPETHIPLLISLPGQRRNYTETENADLSDIAPTILSLLGIAVPSWMDGHPLIDAAASPPAPSFSMYLAESSVFSKPTAGTIAANSGPYHLVWYFPAGRSELFDIAHDPEQTLGTSAFAPPGTMIALIKDIERRFCDRLNSGPPACPR